MPSLKEYITKDLREATVREAQSRVPSIVKLDGLIKVVQPTETTPRLDWHTVDNPTRLKKRYELYTLDIVKYFVLELLDYEMRTLHNAKIIIENTQVIIEVYTHDINDITSADRDYAQFADQLYVDAITLYNSDNVNQQMPL